MTVTVDSLRIPDQRLAALGVPEERYDLARQIVGENWSTLMKDRPASGWLVDTGRSLRGFRYRVIGQTVELRNIMDYAIWVERRWGPFAALVLARYADQWIGEAALEAQTLGDIRIDPTRIGIGDPGRQAVDRLSFGRFLFDFDGQAIDTRGLPEGFGRDLLGFTERRADVGRIELGDLTGLGAFTTSPPITPLYIPPPGLVARISRRRQETREFEFRTRRRIGRLRAERSQLLAQARRVQASAPERAAAYRLRAAEAQAGIQVLTDRLRARLAGPDPDLLTLSPTQRRVVEAAIAAAAGAALATAADRV